MAGDRSPPSEFDRLPTELMVTVFKALTSEDQFYAKGVCTTWYNLIPMTSLDLNVSDTGVLVTIRLLRGIGVTKFIDDDAEEEDGIYKMPDRFWPIVKSLRLNGCITKFHEVMQIAKMSMQIEKIKIFEPSDNLCQILEELLTNNGSTLSHLEYLDTWCGEEPNHTDFDFGWVAKCSALRQLKLMTRSNKMKRMELMPLGITEFFTWSAVPMETLAWMADNLQGLETLQTGINELLDFTIDEPNDMPNTMNLLMMLSSLPKFHTLNLVIYSKGLSRSELLQWQLESTQEMCKYTIGVQSSLINLGPFSLFLPVNKVHYLFACEIDRSLFSGW